MKFSVICTIFNSEKYLDKCIMSIIDQQYQDWELLLIDDGSTDSSFNICKKYSYLDSRVTVFRNANSGPYNERIFGYKKATGDYILSLDSDDFYEKDALSRIAKIINEKNPDLLFFNCFLIENNKKTILDKNLYTLNIMESKEEILNANFSNFTLNQGLYRKCFKKILLDKVDLSDRKERIFEDGLFTLKLLVSVDRVLFINDCFYNYVKQNQQSLTKIYASNMSIPLSNLLEQLTIINTLPSLTSKSILRFNSILIKSAIEYLMHQLNGFKKNKDKWKYLNFFLKNNVIKSIFSYNIKMKIMKINYFRYLSIKYKLRFLTMLCCAKR